MKESQQSQEYLKQPLIVTVVDSRADTGALLHRIAKSPEENQQLIQLNWFMSLTNEKIRLLCKVNAINPGNSEQGNQKLLPIWQ